MLTGMAHAEAPWCCLYRLRRSVAAPQAVRDLWQRMQALGAAKIGDGPLVDDHMNGVS